MSPPWATCLQATEVRQGVLRLRVFHLWHTEHSPCFVCTPCDMHQAFLCGVWTVLPLKLCISHLSWHWDKIPDTPHLKIERFTLVHSSQVSAHKQLAIPRKKWQKKALILWEPGSRETKDKSEREIQLPKSRSLVTQYFQAGTLPISTVHCEV